MARAAGVSVSAVQGIWKAHGLMRHRVRTFRAVVRSGVLAKLRDAQIRRLGHAARGGIAGPKVPSHLSFERDRRGLATMTRNDKYFTSPIPTETFLRARGFDAQGQRSGGIISPQSVELPGGAILFRLYHDQKKRLGEWWSTPYELSVINGYFDRSGPAFAAGRAEGKGILHATLAVRHDWSGHSSQHLGRFLVVRLAEPLKAYHGEGDHAPDATQRQVQKALTIIDPRSHRQRLARQIFLPRPWEYQHALVVLREDVTDTGLLSALETFGHRGALPFEV
jgi:hypothetical protein